MLANGSGWPRGTAFKDDECGNVDEMGDKDCRPEGGRDQSRDAG